MKMLLLNNFIRNLLLVVVLAILALSPLPLRAQSGGVTLSVQTKDCQSGGPLSGAGINIQDASGKITTGETDTNGVANFGVDFHLTAGQATLGASHQNYQDYSATITLASGDNVRNICLTPNSGGDNPPGGGGSGGGNNTAGEISGNVWNYNNGAMIAGATITVQESQVGVNKNTTTDSQGHYRLTELYAGVYATITVTASGYNPSSRSDFIPSYPIVRDFPLVPSSSTNQVAYLSGRTTIIPGDVPLIQCAITLKQGSLIATTNPDGQGNYLIASNYGFKAGAATLTFDPSAFGPGYETLIKTSTINLVAGENKSNFQISLLTPNQVEVRVVNPSTNRTSNIDLVLIIKHNNKTYYHRLSNGYALIPLADLLGERVDTTGSYSVTGYLSRTALQPMTDTKSFSCSQNFNCKAKVTLAQKNSYSNNRLTFTVYEDGGDIFVSNAQVIILDKNGRREITRGTTNARGQVTFTLTANAYKYEVRKNQFYLEKGNIEVYTSPMQKFIYLQRYHNGNNTNDCRYRGTVEGTQYWDCGDEANNMNIPAIDSQIQTTLSSLKGQTGFTEAPQLILIESSSSNTTGYIPLEAKNCLYSPFNKDRLLGNETIMFSTAAIKKYLQKNILSHVVTHEFGHLTDLHKGQCVKFWSDSNPFDGVRQVGAHYGQDYWLPLKDSTYDPQLPEGGHPEDENTETFASAFHDEKLHSSAYPDQSSTLNQQIKDAVRPILIMTGGMAQ